ncbi:nitrilase-related carbon-nitrogen hydrolase [Microbacterium oxydans]|uniref:nitrilase-related carbon-nitrogen hydrolase n=1 Tax=Microbacterium oxydans TaxID=82380 RepID=UPI0024ACD530|nr:nitrilase-related carbon-nitrogen hydrolase [Microbacterium oxydans]
MSHETVLRVASIEVDVAIGAVDENVDKMAEAVRRGIQQGARLVVLPELVTSGYVFDDAAEATAAAMTSSDERLLSVAAQVPVASVAVVGFLENAAGSLYNSAVVLSGGAVIGRYRKSHLWGREAEIFTPGTSAGIVVETPIGRLGVAICYDNEFPEVPRRLALAGAAVLALPVNWPMVPRPTGEHPPEMIQAMGSARSSRLPTVIADRHGRERGVDWTGGTAVIDGDGWIAAQPRNGIAIADLVVRPGDKRLSPSNDLFRDRRPELYAGISPAGGGEAAPERPRHVL